MFMGLTPEVSNPELEAVANSVAAAVFVGVSSQEGASDMLRSVQVLYYYYY
jgi:hypothetical protein